jgi:hypothetical protein
VKQIKKKKKKTIPAKKSKSTANIKVCRRKVHEAEERKEAMHSMQSPCVVC